MFKKAAAGRISIEFSLSTTVVFKAGLPCYTITGVNLPHPEEGKPLEKGGILNREYTPENGPGKPVEFRVTMTSDSNAPDFRTWSVQSVKCLDEGIHYPSQKLPFILGIKEGARKKWIHHFGWAPKPETELIRKHCEWIQEKAREERGWQIRALTYFRQFDNSPEYLRRKARELAKKSDVPNQYRARSAWGFENRKAPKTKKTGWRKEGFAPSRSKNKPKNRKGRESRDLFTPLRSVLENV